MGAERLGKRQERHPQPGAQDVYKRQLLPCLTALIYRESAGLSFLIVAFALLIAGVLCTFRKPANKAFYAREGFAVVALSWILLSVTGALPFVISGEIPHFIDAMFETCLLYTSRCV